MAQGLRSGQGSADYFDAGAELDDDDDEADDEPEDDEPEDDGVELAADPVDCAGAELVEVEDDDAESEGLEADDVDFEAALLSVR